MTRTRQSPGNAAANAASAMTRTRHEKGKRTAVMPADPLRKGRGITEDPDIFFANAKNPEQADMAAGEKSNAASKQDGLPSKRAKKRAAAIEPEGITFPGAEETDSTSRLVNAKPGKNIGAVIQTQGKQKANPRLSDISMVSTLASPASVSSPKLPTPKASSTAKTAIPQESPVITQGAQREDAAVAKHAAATDTEEQLENHEEGFPTDMDPVDEDRGDDDDDVDLLPPAPPAEEDRQEEVEAGGENTSPQQDGGFPTAFDDDDGDENQGGGFTLAEQSDEEDNESSKSEDLEHGSELKENRTPEGSGGVESDDDKEQKLDEENNDDDDDKEGGGFNLVHDPETPESVRQQRTMREEEAFKKRGKKAKKKPSSLRKRKNDYASDSDNSETPAKSLKSRKTKKKVRISTSPMGYPVGPRDYEAIPVEDLIQTPDDSERDCRRSRRAKTKPLAYWKNERPEFGPNNELGQLGEAMGNMPVVKKYVKALPTPYRKRKNVVSNTRKSGQGGQKRARLVDSGIISPYDTKKLRRKHEYLDGEIAKTWDDGVDDVVDKQVVAYTKNLDRHDLPLVVNRKKSEGRVVGRAAQAFNVQNDENDKYVGYIMGHLELPPRGIKDAESVGECAQTFTVVSCQPDALEVAFADPRENEGDWDSETAQRFLLSPGDMFRVPQGNCYRVQNHSTTTDCLLTWTIIRPKV